MQKRDSGVDEVEQECGQFDVERVGVEQCGVFDEGVHKSYEGSQHHQIISLHIINYLAEIFLLGNI